MFVPSLVKFVVLTEIGTSGSISYFVDLLLEVP
jgi:hypothetical protein